jgi:tetratricopeptide (TPR) repeat protein
MRRSTLGTLWLASVAAILVGQDAASARELDTIRENGQREFDAGRFQAAAIAWKQLEVRARAISQLDVAAEALCLQSRAEQGLGRDDDSVRLADECLDTLLDINQRHADALQRLVDALEFSGRGGEAQEVLSRHIHDMRLHGGHADCDLLLLTYQLGALYQAHDRIREAEDAYLDGVRILQSRREQPDDGLLATYLDALSELYLRSGERTRAADLCQRRQELHLRVEGPSRHVIDVLEECSRLLAAVGRGAESAALQERARQMLDELNDSTQAE